MQQQLMIVLFSIGILFISTVFGGVVFSKLAIDDDDIAHLQTVCGTSMIFDPKEVEDAFKNYYELRGNIDMLCYFLHSEVAEISSIRNGMTDADRKALVRSWENMKRRQLIPRNSCSGYDSIDSFTLNYVKDSINDLSILRDPKMLCYFLTSENDEIGNLRMDLKYHGVDWAKLTYGWSASRNVSLEVLKIIVEYDLPVLWIRKNPCKNWRQGELERAQRNDNLEYFKVLLDDPRTLPYGEDGRSQNPLLLAARYCQVEMLELLLEDGRSIPTYDHDYAFRWALGYCPKAVELLLKDGRVKLTDNEFEEAKADLKEKVKLKRFHTATVDEVLEILSKYQELKI